MICDFNKLLLYMEKKLDLDAKLEVLEHLETCEICFEAIYLMSRDRDARFLIWDAPEYELAS